MTQSKGRWIQSLVRYENHFTWGANAGISITALVVLYGLAEGAPTLPPWLGWLHISIVMWLGWTAFHCLVFIVASLFALLRLPIPRLFSAHAICFVCGVAAGWAQASISLEGAIAVSLIYVLIAITSGSAIAMLIMDKHRVPALLYATLAGITAVGGFVWLYGPGASVFPPETEHHVVSQQVLLPDNPAASGGYEVKYFTYGSGSDLHRKEFADDVDIISKSVDASFFLDEFNEMRKIFWGFGADALPLNGRVWMPQGTGPFPLALIVHGNHHMEYFSDEGYAYLGELLASRGMIVVSVDENFINYSNWSGSVDPDMTVRAWLLLQHMDWIAEMNNNEEHDFFEKVDLQHVAFMGHSRGGQAAALAASFDQFFEHSDVFTSPENGRPYTVRSVVAIAPIDRSVDKKYVNLSNVNYFVLQGSMDADVNVFYGSRQYERVSWDDEGEYFKSSLYIQGANHGQFNTQWGTGDVSAPVHLLLNRKDMLSGDDQREVAKLFISAFLEATLLGNDAYQPLFTDYRQAVEWLPSTTYLQRYENSEFVPIARYDEDKRKDTTTIQGGNISAFGLRTWSEQTILDREGDSLLNDAVLIDWDGKTQAWYEINIANVIAPSLEHQHEAWLAFDLANANLERETRNQTMSDVWLEIQTDDGDVFRRRLSELATFPPVIHSRFTKSVLFEKWVRKGKLGDSAEISMQTFIIPLSTFGADSQLSTGKLSRIRFLFPQGSEGKIILDNIGIYPQTNFP